MALSEGSLQSPKDVLGRGDCTGVEVRTALCVWETSEKFKEAAQDKSRKMDSDRKSHEAT